MGKLCSRLVPKMICEKCGLVHVGGIPRKKLPIYTVTFKCKACSGRLLLYEKAWFGTKDTTVFKIMGWIVVPLMIPLSLLFIWIAEKFIENKLIILLLLILVMMVFYFATGLILAKIRKPELKSRI